MTLGMFTDAKDYITWVESRISMYEKELKLHKKIFADEKKGIGKVEWCKRNNIPDYAVESAWATQLKWRGDYVKYLKKQINMMHRDIEDTKILYGVE